MKIKVELDLTPDEAKELFVPSDKQVEFTDKLYAAYIDALNALVIKHIDPYNFTGLKDHKL
jgi:hypothetical protein